MLTLFCQKNESLITYRYTAEFAVFGMAKGDNLPDPVHILKTKMTGFPQTQPRQGKEHEQSKGFMIGFTITPALTHFHPALKLGIIHGAAI